MVIGPDGNNLGRMSSRAANELAASYSLDLFRYDTTNESATLK